MTSVVTLLLLPLRAPMLLVLLVISTYLGMHWSKPGSWADVGTSGFTEVIWSVECLHSLVVVFVCTMPDLLLRRVSSIMAASRVASLVLTLLMVTIGGIYLLHLDVLSNVLILGSAVLLARLDLLRLRVLPPPFVMTLILSVLVLGGATVGRSLEAHLRQAFPAPEQARPAASRSGGSQAPQTTGATTAPALDRPAGNAAGTAAQQPSTPTAAASNSPAGVTAATPDSPSPAARPSPMSRSAGPQSPGRAPERSVPQLESGDDSPVELP